MAFLGNIGEKNKKKIQSLIGDTSCPRNLGTISFRGLNLLSNGGTPGQTIYSPEVKNSSPLKDEGWKITFLSFWEGKFSGSSC